MNKRILFSLIGWISLACTAMAQPTFRVEDTMANKGDSIEIDVTVDDYIDIVGGQFSMNYDSLVLKYRRVKNANPVLSPPFVVGPPDIRKGYLRFTWNDPGAQGSTLPDGTRLYTLVFDVIGDPCDSTDVEFSDVPLAIEILDETFEDIGMIQDNGVFKVPGQNCAGGGGEGDVEIIASNVSGAKGTNVCVKFSVNNFDNIDGFQFSIKYNNTVLGNAVPQNFNLDGLTLGSFNVNQNAGTIAVAWFDNSGVGISVPDGRVIFEVCFDIIGNAGQSSNIEFTNTPVEIQFSNPDEILDVVTTNGRVSVSGGGGTGDEVVLTASMERANPGERVCVDVTVDNFVDVAGFQFTMTHNPSILDNPGPENLNLPDFTSGSFNIDTTAGVITVSWNTFEGITVPDGTVIFQMCYDVIGSIGQMSPVSFVNSPVPIEFFTIDENLDVITNNGKVTVGTGEGDLRLEVKDTTVQLDGNGCVRFVVENFENVDAFQFVIMYDPNKLTNWNIRDFALPSPLLTNEISPGMIRVLYSDDLGVGRSLPDGATLFEFCFEVTGDCDDETIVKPIDDPNFPTQFSNPDEDLPFELIPGTVTISCQMCDPIGINAINNSNVSCNDLCDGSISIVPRGGDGTYGYSWTRNGMPFPGNSGTITALCAGTYELTVTSCDLSAKFLYTITEPTAITISQVELVNETCRNGVIEVLATGGTGTKTYRWSSGQMTPRITGLTAGTYTVTVTDENDCEATRSFELTGPGELILEADDVTDMTCNEEHAICDGAIELTVTGGCAPVSITWTGPNGTTFSGSTITGLCAGSYTVTIRDSQGTQISRTYMVRQPAVIEIRSTDIMCATPGMSDGKIDPIIVGGTPIGDYDYVWTDSDGNMISTERVLTNVPAGVYTLCITDGVGCEYCEDIVLCSSEIGVGIDGNQVSCFGECDATLEVNITGGIAPYEIEWSDGSDELIRENVCVGLYTVRVTDASGISKTESYTVTGPDELVVDVIELSCATMNGQDGSYEVDIEGGNSPYAVTWCNGSTSPNATNLNTGACNVLVVDDNGCQQFVEFRVCGESDPDNCYEGGKIITPNGDNVNEYFVISCVDQYPNTLLIFDRMGQTIYEQRNYDNRWNGFTQSGTEVTDGGYLWVLRVDLPNGTERVFKGVVNVLR